MIEYLVREICELAGNAATDNGKKRINPRHLMMAIKKDEEIDKLLTGVTISQGGVLPKIHPKLLPIRTRVCESSQPNESISTQTEQHQHNTDSQAVHRQKSEKGVKKKASRMEIDENEE